MHYNERKTRYEINEMYRATAVLVIIIVVALLCMLATEFSGAFMEGVKESINPAR